MFKQFTIADVKTYCLCCGTIGECTPVVILKSGFRYVDGEKLSVSLCK